MKRIIFLLMLGISLSLTSCLKEDTISAPSVNDVQKWKRFIGNRSKDQQSR